MGGYKAVFNSQFDLDSSLTPTRKCFKKFYLSRHNFCLLQKQLSGIFSLNVREFQREKVDILYPISQSLSTKPKKVAGNLPEHPILQFLCSKNLLSLITSLVVFILHSFLFTKLSSTSSILFIFHHRELKHQRKERSYNQQSC